MGKRIRMTSTAIGQAPLEHILAVVVLCMTTSETEEEPLEQDINKKIMGAGIFPAPII